jgi:thymidylate synthase (FAD)
MRNVPIEFFLVAQTRVNPEAVKKWLEFLGVSEKYNDDLFDLMDPYADSGSTTEENITDPALLIALAAKRCYKSFEPSLNPNLSKVRSDWTEYLDNVLKSRHGSVCEHACYSFAIENVSRVFTGEMNRHRAGVAVSEGSMRFIRYDDIPSWLPTSIQVTPEEVTLYNQVTMYDPDHNTYDRAHFELVRKKIESQDVFKEVYEFVEGRYKKLTGIWKDELSPESKFKAKKHVTSMMRRIVPMGVATGGVWTLNIRALRHIMAMRASDAAEEEIFHVWSRIGKEMVTQEPMLIGADFSQTAEGFWVPKYDKI